MGEMMSNFNPLIFSSTENAAFNAAHASWSGIEVAAHVLLPLAPIAMKFTYNLAKFVFANRAPQPVHAPAPAQNEGWLSWGWSKVKSAAKWVGAPMGASYAVHKLWAEQKWDDLRLNATSFMRPFFEKLLPKFYAVWDKGDINFSARDLTFETILASPAYGVRSFINWALTSKPALQANTIAETYYDSGKAWATWCAQNYQLASTMLDGIWRSPECLRSSAAFQQCASDAANFGNHVVDTSPLLTSIKSTVGGALGSWWESAKNGAIYYPTQAVNLINHGMWALAQAIESKTGLPAHAIYYAEVAAGGYLSVKLAKVIAQLGFEKMRLAVLKGQGRGVQQNNHVVVHKGNQAPLATQTAVPVSPANGNHVAPQQQVTVINGNGGQCQHVNGQPPQAPAGLGLQQEGDAHPLPRQNDADDSSDSEAEVVLAAPAPLLRRSRSLSSSSE